MKLNKLHLISVGGITDLELFFDSHMNVICGPNGVGKTTILESVAHCFTAQQTSILKRNVASEAGSIEADIEDNEELIIVKIHLKEFDPTKGDHITGLHGKAAKLLSLKVNRTFNYQSLDSVSRDQDKPTHTVYEEAKSGVRVQDVKNWFVNRYLYSAHPNALTESQLHNLEVAKRGFSVLQDGFSFSRVMASSNEIMVNSPSGEIYYEYLSSGFKSCLSVFFGIIKEIEYRFKNVELKADEFDGIVLVDEIELHLHPEWQTKISSLLRIMFPLAQFIVSTHSPHVIQSAMPDEVIALEFEGSLVARREIANDKYGFQGWSIEDILIDIMGMRDVRTEKFRSTMRVFEAALENNNYQVAEQIYKEVDELLHPSDVLRKLLKVQLAGLDRDDD